MTSGGSDKFEHDIGRLARHLYTEGPLSTRLIQRHRHRICPLELVSAQVAPGSTVLDVGCGGGLLVAHLAATGRARSARGIDASAPAIDAAKAMTGRLGDAAPEASVSFEHWRVEQGLPDDEFDAVCLIDVLHHVPPSAQETAFRDAASRVRRGGVLVYKDMCDAPLWRASMNRLHDLVMARQWIRYVPIERVEGWASEAGLELQTARDVNMLWYGHELRVFVRPGDGA